jgi:GST-like protein
LHATATKPVELHYAPTPNGWKVTLLLEESGLPYQVKPIDMAAGDQHTEDFLRLSPNGRMPALHDPNVGVDIFESGAIMLHLAENYVPAARFLLPEERSSAMQWLFWVNAGLGPMAGQFSHFKYYARQVAPGADHAYALDRYRREFDRLISVLDRRVGCSGGFLSGKTYGVADMAAWPWVKPWKRWMGGKSLRDSGYDAAFLWYEQIKERPATERALGVLREEAKAAQKLRDEGGMAAGAIETMFKQGGKQSSR